MSTTWHTPDPVQGAAIDALGGGTGLISMPNDDELVRAAIVRLPTEMLADWIAYIRQPLAGVSRPQTSSPYPDTELNWSIAPDGFWKVATIGAKLYQPLRIPAGSTLSEVFVFIDPANEARGGLLPGIMPAIRLIKIGSAGSVTVVASATDASASQAAYENPHPIIANGLAEVIDPQVLYRVELSTEGGANSFDETVYIMTVCGYTRGPVDPG